MLQDEVIAFLKSPHHHPGGGPVEVVQTHGAFIFLAGDVALKIKRAVRYDYMDFSTLKQRGDVLRRELELNKRSAPQIYLDVVPLVRTQDGRLAIDGDGEPVEWILRMWRFPKTDELGAIADARGIDDALADNLGKVVFEYHAHAPVRALDGANLIRDILDELDRVFAEMKEPLGPERIDCFHRESRAALDRNLTLLRHRADAGHVRRCHGDLHLRNLVLLDGMPVLFDALEFDETLGTCDVLYDLAFLIMDLLHKNQNSAANVALNSYLLAAKGDEDEGLATLPLFLAIRAAIRAMVSVQTADATNDAPSTDARQFLRDAIAFLQPAAPMLVLVGGLSGTGKTVVSRALAPSVGGQPGAAHLRTDLERKTLSGMAVQQRLGPDNYTSEARDAIYRRMFDRAARILGAGQSVLLDATFSDPSNRLAAEAIADEAGVNFRAIWLDAPLPILIERVQKRSGDASDADESVVRAQFAQCSAPAEWDVVSAAGTLQETLENARRVLLPERKT